MMGVVIRTYSDLPAHNHIPSIGLTFDDVYLDCNYSFIYLFVCRCSRCSRGNPCGCPFFYLFILFVVVLIVVVVVGATLAVALSFFYLDRGNPCLYKFSIFLWYDAVIYNFLDIFCVSQIPFLPIIHMHMQFDTPFLQSLATLFF